jgi:hypothetical protein
MGIVAAGQRRTLYDKNLLYLFSYDLTLKQEEPALSAEGLKVQVTLDESVPAPAYHVFDDSIVEDNDALVGTVRWTEEDITVGAGGVGEISGVIALATDDGAVIDSRYQGSMLLGPLGGRCFAAPANPAAPSRVRVRSFIAPRFDSPYTKYKWLTERQCAGFGMIEMFDGRIVTATFDIYAMR